MMNVSLQQLRVFQAVAAEHNFSRAGARLGLTQPAVSRAVTELEGQLGLRLFDRTTREVAPTPRVVVPLPMALQTWTVTVPPSRSPPVPLLESNWVPWVECS